MEIFDHEINQYLENHGVKHSNIGYSYLFEIMKILTKDPNRKHQIMKLYGLVAEKFDVKAMCVEKAIRYAIMSVDITNKEFISKAMDDLKYKTKKNNELMN